MGCGEYLSQSASPRPQPRHFRCLRKGYGPRHPERFPEFSTGGGRPPNPGSRITARGGPATTAPMTAVGSPDPPPPSCGPRTGGGVSLCVSASAWSGRARARAPARHEATLLLRARCGPGWWLDCNDARRAGRRAGTRRRGLPRRPGCWYSFTLAQAASRPAPRPCRPTPPTSARRGPCRYRRCPQTRCARCPAGW
jgi:hypothetical protein